MLRSVGFIIFVGLASCEKSADLREGEYEVKSEIIESGCSKEPADSARARLTLKGEHVKLEYSGGLLGPLEYVFLRNGKRLSKDDASHVEGEAACQRQFVDHIEGEISGKDSVTLTYSMTMTPKPLGCGGLGSGCRDVVRERLTRISRP